jgi:aminobenzoyl-glutamate transport protein
MSAADAAALKKANQSSGFLNWIEKVGNKVPDPTIMFLYLIAFIAVLSWILSWIGVSVTIRSPHRCRPASSSS